ncbi:MAG TPA: GMC oxidoreductase [Ramlibacter sp.]|nr:GMC oxidoreductase [Ramlibacter sp.]
MLQGRQLRALGAAAPLQSLVRHEIEPGPQVQSDCEWLDYAARHGSTAYHAMGTARMGPATEPRSVVDPQLRVHGLAGLRVADASVMPAMPSANTAATTMMIVERAAALVLQAR